MISTTLSEAISHLETCRCRLVDSQNTVAKYRMEEKLSREFAEKYERELADKQRVFDQAMLRMREIMSGPEDEVTVEPSSVEQGEQVGREG